MNNKSLTINKRILILALALVIGSFSFVGFLSMAEMPDHGEHCPISFLMASDCASYTHAIGMAIHHILITKSFSQGTIVGAVALLMLLFFWIIREAPDITNSRRIVKYKMRPVEEILLLYFQKFIKWLTIVSSREYAYRFWAHIQIVS